MPKQNEKTKPVDIMDEDEDDLLPIPEAASPKARMPKAKAAAPKKSKAKKPMADGGDEDGEDGEGSGGPTIELIPNRNRKGTELEARMAARLSGKPLFPYPEELPDHHKHYWLQLVNCFAKDHFSLADVPLLKIYVRAAYDQDRIEHMLEEEGEVVTDPRGKLMLNPRCKARDSAAAFLLSIATKIRAQPASRSNTDDFKGRQNKADSASTGAAAIGESDGLLAGSRGTLQ